MLVLCKLLKFSVVQFPKNKLSVQLLNCSYQTKNIYIYIYIKRSLIKFSNGTYWLKMISYIYKLRARLKLISLSPLQQHKRNCFESEFDLC